MPRPRTPSKTFLVVHSVGRFQNHNFHAESQNIEEFPSRNRRTSQHPFSSWLDVVNGVRELESNFNLEQLPNCSICTGTVAPQGQAYFLVAKLQLKLIWVMGSQNLYSLTVTAWGHWHGPSIKVFEFWRRLMKQINVHWILVMSTCEVRVPFQWRRGYRCPTGSVLLFVEKLQRKLIWVMARGSRSLTGISHHPKLLVYSLT